VGFRFTLVLSRVISDEESAVLREAGCAGAVFAEDSLPTNAEVPVTRVDVDDCVSASLEAAIEAGLAAVKQVPDLSVPGLTVPAQPAFPPDADTDAVIQGSVIEETATAGAATQDTAVQDGTAAEEPAANKKTTAGKPAAKKKPSAKKANPRNSSEGASSEKVDASPASS
jgi:hypothetical protein